MKPIESCVTPFVSKDLASTINLLWNVISSLGTSISYIVSADCPACRWKAQVQGRKAQARWAPSHARTRAMTREGPRRGLWQREGRQRAMTREGPWLVVELRFLNQHHDVVEMMTMMRAGSKFNFKLDTQRLLVEKDLVSGRLLLEKETARRRKNCSIFSRSSGLSAPQVLPVPETTPTTSRGRFSPSSSPTSSPTGSPKGLQAQMRHPPAHSRKGLRAWRRSLLISQAAAAAGKESSRRWLSGGLKIIFNWPVKEVVWMRLPSLQLELGLPAPIIRLLLDQLPSWSWMWRLKLTVKVEASMANLDNSVQSKEIAAAAVHGVFCVIEQKAWQSKTTQTWVLEFPNRCQ